MSCSRRSSATFWRSLQLQEARDERLLARLRELQLRLDPVPEHAITAARSALGATMPGCENQSGEHPLPEPSRDVGDDLLTPPKDHCAADTRRSQSTTSCAKARRRR